MDQFVEQLAYPEDQFFCESTKKYWFGISSLNF